MTSHFVSDEGENVRGVGYHMRDDEGLAVPHDHELLASAGIAIFNVAGASFRPAELRRPECEAGRPFTLIREPDNPKDRNAVAVWDAERRPRIGYVPRDRARDASSTLRRGELESFLLWEWIGEDGRRSGLTVLAAPTGVLDSSVDLPGR